MFKWYMTEKFSLTVLNTGVLMYGFFKFYCICTFCTGLPVLPSGRSRPSHKVSGTQSKFPNLNGNGQKSHFLRGFSDSEPGQHFV